MITVYGEGRGFRVVWLLEEMGLAYTLRPVDLMAGVEKDPEFLSINPGGFIPAIVDGHATMVESITIMQYLMARYGPTSLAPAPRASEQLLQRICNRLPVFGERANAFAELLDGDGHHVERMQHHVDFFDAKNRIHARASHCRLLRQCGASPKRQHHAP